MQHKNEIDFKHRIALVFFFLSPLLILVVVYNTLNSHASSLPPADPPQYIMLQWQKTATPFSELTAQETPAPLGGQDTQTQLIYLPIIHKSLILSPDYGLIAAYGPIVDPAFPGSIRPAEKETPQIPPSPTPLPPEPTPGGSPTPGPGTPTWTPTSKPTITPTGMPTATPVLVERGDLESRQGWSEFSLLDYPLFFDSDGIPEAPPKAFDGDWYAWLGGDSGEISYIQRQFTVPNPRDGDYERYWLTHMTVRQSYDIACANEVYDYLGSPDKEEFLSGHLRFATRNTLDQYGVDLGGMLICVNNSDASGCNDSAVQNVTANGQTRKAVFVSYYELCETVDGSDGSDWFVFFFPLSNADLSNIGTDLYNGLLPPSQRFPQVTFNDGSTDLAGKTITVQIKVITDPDFPDEKTASSVLVDDVMWWGGPPVPSLTPTPRGADGSSVIQSSDDASPTATATPVFALTPYPPPAADSGGAYFLPAQLDTNSSTSSKSDKPYLKTR